MTEIHRVGDLEIPQDVAFERRLKNFQNGARLGMAVVVLAALLGVFGVGPLDRGSARSGGLRLDYARFPRLDAPTRLRVSVLAAPVEGGEIRLWIDQGYLGGLYVLALTPAPVSAEAGAGRLTYTFRVDGGDGAPEIAFTLIPQIVGLRTGRLGLAGEEPLVFRQFVYP